MIIYSKTKGEFMSDAVSGEIDDKIKNLVYERFGRKTPRSELQSWRNSLARMSLILGDSDIPDNAGVAIEYNIPYTSKRVDMIITGKDGQNHNSAVIVELKQWEEAEAVRDKDGIVRTYLGGGVRETTHPSYQAWSYAMAISDFNADVQDNDVQLKPCAYLHNYVTSDDDPILGEIYLEYLEKSPVFTKNEGKKLQKFLKKFIIKGDDGETIFMIDSGNLRPSKSLQDSIASMMTGNREFTMMDSQKVIYESILNEARRVSKGGKKSVFIVKGGPGTGKSVLAINLLSQLIIGGMSAIYVSSNAAPRYVYNQKLKGTMKKSHVDMLFKGSGSFTKSPEDVFDVLLTDEAHRLNAKSGFFSNLGENQIKEIIRSSKLSVFFIDEDQRVTLKDIGTVGEIKHQAEVLGVDVLEAELDSQFRCSGSDGYLSWLDHVLQIRDTANVDFNDTFDYDFRIFDDPCELREAIEEKNRACGKSRMVAGYCWEWSKGCRDDSDVHDVVIPGTGFGMSWNLGSTKTWAIDAGSIDEIGCIHTCQGLEFNYVGVIIGPDMRYASGGIITDPYERAKTDKSLNGFKKRIKEGDKEIRDEVDKIIKNTYKVLMSRGMKGCYVYCCDRELAEFLRESVRKSSSEGDFRPSLRGYGPMFRIYRHPPPAPSSMMSRGNLCRMSTIGHMLAESVSHMSDFLKASAMASRTLQSSPHSSPLSITFPQQSRLTRSI